MRSFMIGTPLEVTWDWIKMRDEKLHDRHSLRGNRGLEKTAV
jgi:hypothetical protein